MQPHGRRDFLKSMAPAALSLQLGAQEGGGTGRPNVLYLMTDQFRFDAIAALGNAHIYTPNLDRLVRRGVTFTNAYAQCPVCVPARYSVRTGCEPPTTRTFENGRPKPAPGQPAGMVERCGPYLAQTMKGLGYRTFGIGKFHTMPWDEPLGYDVHLHSEELYGTPDQRRRDSFASWIRTQHPQFNYVEQPMGERTEMYYMPQTRPLPAELAVERWAADRAVEQLKAAGSQPYFGFVSFVGPHPPLAPPIPFNRLYDPDRMPNPVRGELEVDHMDEQIPWMNYAIWAEDVNDPHARVLKARYYGAITFVDDCIGRILDAVEARPDADNTVIAFFTDHGDHLGDHHAWQKESFFEASSHIPYLVSWPARIPGGQRRGELVCQTDLFGIATGAAGKQDLRQGRDVLGMLQSTAKPREHLLGYYGEPGSPQFKMMARQGDWKYIFMANGGREQLFNVREDPNELRNLAESRASVKRDLHALAADDCKRPELAAAREGEDLKRLPFRERPRTRIYQFDRSRGVTGFFKHPRDVLANWRAPQV